MGHFINDFLSYTDLGALLYMPTIFPPKIPLVIILFRIIQSSWFWCHSTQLVEFSRMSYYLDFRFF